MTEETKVVMVDITAVPLGQKVDMIERSLEHLLNVLLVPIRQLDPKLKGEIKAAMAILKVPPQK
jgi:hypothetical protein